jgi:hypothetical protein
MGDGALRVRVSAGVRRRQWAVEGWFAGAIYTGRVGYDTPPTHPNPDSKDPLPPTSDYGHGMTNLTMYGLDLKYLNPISQHVDLYLRGSMSGAVADGDLEGYSGRGLGFGAGLQLKGKVPALGFLWWPFFFTNWGPKVTAALWVDTGYDFYRLHGPSPTAVDAQLTHLTGGFAVGNDF